MSARRGGRNGIVGRCPPGVAGAVVGALPVVGPRRHGDGQWPRGPPAGVTGAWEVRKNYGGVIECGREVGDAMRDGAGVPASGRVREVPAEEPCTTDRMSTRRLVGLRLAGSSNITVAMSPSLPDGMGTNNSRRRDCNSHARRTQDRPRDGEGIGYRPGRGQLVRPTTSGHPGRREPPWRSECPLPRAAFPGPRTSYTRALTAGRDASAIRSVDAIQPLDPAHVGPTTPDYSPLLKRP